MSSLDDEGLIGESPYIGRGRFRPNEHSRESMLPPGQSSPYMHGRSPSGSGSGSLMDSETRERMHVALDEELEEKRQAINNGRDYIYLGNEKMALIARL